MITFIIGLLIIGGSVAGVVCVIGMMLAGFTPGRRTRGLARWWSRCWRWTRVFRLKRHEAQPHRVKPEGYLPPWTHSRSGGYAAAHGDPAKADVNPSGMVFQPYPRGHNYGRSHWTNEPIELLTISIDEIANSEED